MLTSLLCLLALAVTPSTQPTPTTLPAGWPPLPDFKKPVDYVGWLEDQLKPMLADDAAPVWAELDCRDEDLAKADKAFAQLWGALPNDQIPGLFTGEDKEPDDYRWDPKDHAAWEQSYQMRKSSRLRWRLIAAAKSKYNVPTFHCGDIRLADTQPAILDPDERLLTGCLLPNLGTTRRGVKVLLQDAWRAPGGKINADRMVEAITLSIRIGLQQQQEPFAICWLMGIAQRRLAYESAIRALQPGVMPIEAIRDLQEVLNAYDSAEISAVDARVKDFADWLDIYQFAYSPMGQWPPKASPDHICKIEKILKLWRTDVSPEPSLDPTEVNKYGAEAGVREIVDLHLRICDLITKPLSQDAERDINKMMEEFSQDPSKHVIVRQIARVYGMGLARQTVLAGWSEATRRATHLICAISEEYAARGQWPAKLQDLRGVSPECLIDPFSGKPFIYRIQDGQPLLYSAGMDGKDDGGKHDPHRIDGKPGTDYVFWPVQARQ